MLNSETGVKASGAAPSWSRLLTVAVVAYLLFLLVLLPATTLLGWVEQRGPVRFLGVEGTLWKGRLDRVVAPVELRGVEWRFSPAELLRGGLGFDLGLGGGVATGTVAVSPGGAVFARGVRIDGRLSQLLESIEGVPLLADPRLMGTLAELSWRPEGCGEITDTRLVLDDWRGMMGKRINLLEGVRLDVGCEEKTVVVAIEALSGDANLVGALRLAPSGGYDLQLTAKPTVAALRELFLDLGFQESQGLLRLQQRGRLR